MYYQLIIQNLILNMKNLTKFVLVVTFLIDFSNAYNLRGSIRNSNEQKVADSNEANIIGFILGPLLFFLSFVVIWNNERKAALDYRRLSHLRSLKDQSNEEMTEEGQKSFIKEKIIYTSGKTKALLSLQDKLLNIKMDQVLKLVRVVQVREYRSFDSKQNSEQLFWVSYNDEKVNSKINESENWFIKNETFLNPKVKIGTYFLSQEQISRIQCTNDYKLNISEIQQIQKQFKLENVEPFIEGSYICFPKEKGNYQSYGSLRLKYMFCPEKVISVLCGVTHDNCLQPFRIDKYDNKGKEDEVGCCKCSCCFLCNCTAELLKPIQQINILTEKQETFEEIVDHQLNNQSCLVKTLRFLSFVMLLSGIYFVFWPITDAIGYIPIVGGWITTQANSFILLGSVILGIPLFLITLGFAWVRFNPKIGLPYLLIGLALIVVILIVSLTEG